MITHVLKKLLLGMAVLISTGIGLRAQCHHIPATRTTTDTLTYTFTGGTLTGAPCATTDATYWMSGNGMSVRIDFAQPQPYPSFRVWGMNTDDSATLTVNNMAYALNAFSAAYDAKVTCGLSPGPNGIMFSNNKVVGANTPAQGNYSYNNITLNATNVTTMTLTGVSGAGWGFSGISVNCPKPLGVISTAIQQQINVYPNPSAGHVTIGCDDVLDRVMVTDVLGRTVYSSTPGKKIVSLDLESSGVYFVSVLAAQKLGTATITVIR